LKSLRQIRRYYRFLKRLMNNDQHWESIASEYLKEIEGLHRDIEGAVFELEKRMPRSYTQAISMLDHSLENSHQNIRLIKMSSEPIINIVQKTEKTEEKADCFSNIL
jgi:hypothetical protein